VYPHFVRKVPVLVNFWILGLSESATYTFADASVPTE
jgi:hypothetical protein